MIHAPGTAGLKTAPLWHLKDNIVAPGQQAISTRHQQNARIRQINDVQEQ
ncbi:hypothetical protein [Mycobacterium paraffinicum]|nr:hypothetical protein [Mycobacterium paraffinicum]